MSWLVRAVRGFAVAVVMVLAAGGAAHAAATPTPDVVYPDDPARQQAYEDGFSTGYFDGTDEGYGTGRDDGYRSGYAEGLDTGRQRGIEEGKRQAQDQADLRDDVSDTAEQEPVDEGGRDLGDQITPSPSATPDDGTASTATFEDDTDSGGGFPWWPLSFAVAATAWFVTRRRRLDAEDEE